MQKRANILKQKQPESVHVLLNGNTILVSLNGSEIKTETANSVREKQLVEMVLVLLKIFHIGFKAVTETY